MTFIIIINIKLTSAVIYPSGESHGFGHILLAGLNERFLPGKNPVIKQDDSK